MERNEIVVAAVKIAAIATVSIIAVKVGGKLLDKVRNNETETETTPELASK